MAVDGQVAGLVSPGGDDVASHDGLSGGDGQMLAAWAAARALARAEVFAALGAAVLAGTFGSQFLLADRAEFRRRLGRAEHRPDQEYDQDCGGDMQEAGA